MTVPNNNEQKMVCGWEWFPNIWFFKRSLRGCFLFFAFNSIRSIFFFHLNEPINPYTSLRKHFSPTGSFILLYANFSGTHKQKFIYQHCTRFKVIYHQLPCFQITLNLNVNFKLIIINFFSNISKIKRTLEKNPIELCKKYSEDWNLNPSGTFWHHQTDRPVGVQGKPHTLGKHKVGHVHLLLRTQLTVISLKNHNWPPNLNFSTGPKHEEKIKIYH